MMAKKLISFVLPAYNEEKNIPLVIEDISSHMDQLVQYDFEIILINDGSKDRTREVISHYANEDKRIKAIDLSRNFGHQAALTAGLEHASWDAVVSMDCDLQDPVSVAVQMIDGWSFWSEVVYARRVSRNDNFLKKWTAIGYYKFLSLVSETEIPRNVWDFRLVDRKVLNAFHTLGEKDRYMRGMFARLWFETSYVDFERPERIHGVTWYTWRKMIQLAMDGLLNFSTFPLRMGMLIGLFMIWCAILFLLYMLYDNIIKWVPYALFKWISVFGLGFMWLQFIFIWIVGEYVGRIYNETRDRPIYITSQLLNLDPKND